MGAGHLHDESAFDLALRLCPFNEIGISQIKKLSQGTGRGTLAEPLAARPKIEARIRGSGSIFFVLI
jgi:hypothetical protein